MTEQAPANLENQAPVQTPEDGQAPPANLENQDKPADVDPGEGVTTEADPEAASGNYGYVRPAFIETCPACPATVGAEDQETVKAALEDHVRFAHGDEDVQAYDEPPAQEATEEEAKRVPPTPAPTEPPAQGQE